MPLFDRTALNDGVRRREVLAWATYDFANSGYTTVVLTAVFNAYFVGVVARNAGWATFAWTSVLALSSLVVMFTAPAIGALADRCGWKKRLLAVATIVCVIATAALATVGPGDIAIAAAAVVVSNVCYGLGEALNAAFLPELARRDALGRVSGWGWGFGYFGGMLTLGLSLGWVIHAQRQGLSAAQFVPATMLITAGVYAVASLVTFAWLRERAALPGSAMAAASVPVSATPAAMLRRWRELRGWPDLATLLKCTVAYQAGIAVVIALAAVYAEQVLGFEQTETMLLIFLVNIASAVGAFAFGHWQDRVGHRRALAATLVGWIVTTALAALATGPGLFWAAATLAGLCMGSSQSAGRALVGAFTPRQRLAEFFGLWSFAVRLAAVIGPMTYGLVTLLTAGNHRLAIVSTGAFFVAGWWILRRVDVARGVAAAAAASRRGGADEAAS